MVYIPASVTNIQALLGGSLDVAVPGSSGVVLAAARGAPVVAVAATMNRPPMTLYVQPEIMRADQLKGQVLGITRFNSTAAHTVTTLILRKLGLAVSVTQRPLGGNPEVQGAFEQKQIAGMLTSVRPRIAANALLNAADLEIPFAMNVFAATQDFLQKNSQTAERLLRSVYRRRGRTESRPRNRAEGARQIPQTERTRVSRPDAQNCRTLHRPDSQKVDPRTVATVLEFEPVKGVDADSLALKVIDNGIIDKLVREGFIEKAFAEERVREAIGNVRKCFRMGCRDDHRSQTLA